MRLTLPWNSATDSAGTDNRIGQRSSMLEYDQPLVWVVLLLLLTGVVMVYSASIGLPDSPKYANYKNHHFLMRQSMFVVIGLAAGLFAFRVKIEQWQSAAPLLFALSLALMILVLIPGIGKGVNGARRWIGFGGFSLQPSEILKLMMIFYAADF
ncbi:MAG: FtsW/RodA/SpoVE family cell cycle protein, partial [Oxalobacteraceae bacterium]|nr:FtsW/RodA/SpoVE family cell cycle protein [Oxalobacteraceae bacterium]